MDVQNLLRREPLKLVDGGESQRTFVYIKDAIEAVLLMIVCLLCLSPICFSDAPRYVPHQWNLNLCFLVPKENPARANGHIFNVGNPDNEVTVRELAEMMTEVCQQQAMATVCSVSSKSLIGIRLQVYAKVSGEPPLEQPVIDVSAKEFYGEGYDDSDKRIPDMTLINKQLGMYITPHSSKFVPPFVILLIYTSTKCLISKRWLNKLQGGTPRPLSRTCWRRR